MTFYNYRITGSHEDRIFWDGVIYTNEKPYIPQSITDEYIKYLHQTVKHERKLDDGEFWLYIFNNYSRGAYRTVNNWLNCTVCKDNRYADCWNYTRKTLKTIARTITQEFRE
jgi:hypothetical protein